MKHGWRPPAFSKRSKKADRAELLKLLSDGQLRWLLIRLSPEAEADSILAHSLCHGYPIPEKHQQFLSMMDLRKKAPLHPEAEAMYKRLRFRALLDLRRRARVSRDDTDVSPADDPSTMTFSEWLRARWSSADRSVRDALRMVAGSVGASIPLTRTRKSTVGAKDSGPSARSDLGQQPNQGEPEPTGMPPENESKAPRYDDPPEWHDDHAVGWIPCDSWYAALHPDEDRGWH